MVIFTKKNLTNQVKLYIHQGNVKVVVSGGQKSPPFCKEGVRGGF